MAASNDEGDAFERLNEALDAGFMRIYEALIESGRSEAEAAAEAPRLHSEVIHDIAPALADGWMESGLEHVAELRQSETEFRERLRDHWASGLDLFAVTIEFSQQFVENRIGHRPGLLEDSLIDVLYQLHGQTLRVAREIHVLLSAGYPMGALALTRAAYELSVRAIVLADHARLPEHADLVERYLDHEVVVNAKDAEIYQRDAEALGYEPFEEAFMEEVRGKRVEMLKKYGRDFKHAYGWAIGLPGINFGRRFDELESLAELSHLRGYYLWASHFLHGDAKALRLNMVHRGGAPAVLTAATNVGLADPADHVMLSLYRMVVTLVVTAEANWMDLATLRALRVLIDRAEELLVAAEQSVDEAEERLQHELRAEGKVMTPQGVIDLLSRVEESE